MSRYRIFPEVPVSAFSRQPSSFLCASQLYARNVVELLKLIVKDGKLNLDFNDEIIKGACITHDGSEPG